LSYYVNVHVVKFLVFLIRETLLHEAAPRKVGVPFISDSLNVKQ
jgi:hypothetical protein